MLTQEYCKAGKLHLERNENGAICSAYMTLFNDLVTSGGVNLGRHVYIDPALIHDRKDGSLAQGDIIVTTIGGEPQLLLTAFCPFKETLLRILYSGRMGDPTPSP
jgi:hypothetical protein